MAFQRLGDAPDALGQADDVAQVALRRLRVAALEKPFGVLGIGSDGGHRLVDLVRDAGRDLAERGEAVGLVEIATQGLGPFLGRLARPAFRH